MDGPAQTALSTARVRFIEGLPRRADELRAAIAKLELAPNDEDAREDMRRRLHALYATAQVFAAEALAHAVKEVIARLDGARAAHQSVGQVDFAALRELAEGLRDFASDDVALNADAVAKLSAIANAVPEPQAPIDSFRPSRAPMAVTQTVSGFLAAPAQTAVLVVDTQAVQNRVRGLLPIESFDVSGAADAQSALTMAQTLSPDFVIVSGEIASFADEDLVRRLQSDPLSQLRATYVLLPKGSTYDTEFLRQTGADGVLVEPLDAAALISLIQAHTTTPRRTFDALANFSEGTAGEIAARVAEEIRRGIAESLKSGRNEKIQVGDSTDLMAVAWSAIGKIRAHLAEQSRGRVRFRDDIVQDTPTLLTFVDAADGGQDVKLSPTALSGFRVLVADDDPAVLWFFAGLLREVGAQVIEAQNGQQALELARRRRPHVVVSDILMPKIDGFALCRELKRDVILAQVPVILLSWKEDFLQRMRELDAGASGYLRKEAGSRQILSAVNEALAPRVRLREQMRERAEVRGRVEGLGILPLLETVAAERPDARLSVRDAWNLFEIDVRGGASLRVTRTASDGSYARGDKALLQLVGVTAGRFSLVSADGAMRGAFEAPLEKAVTDASKDLGALLDAVSAARLLHVSLIAFEDEVVASLLSATPTPLAEVVARFRAGGTTAKDLLLDGTFTPGDLETHLRELARRGAISGVWNDEGDDMVAKARLEREHRPGTLMHSSSPPRMPKSEDSVGEKPSTRAEARMAAVSEPPPLPKLPAEIEQAIANAAAAPPTVISIKPVAETPASLPNEHVRAELKVEPKVTPASTRSPSGERMRLLLTLAALFAVGYFAYRAASTPAPSAISQAPAPLAAPTAKAAPVAPAPPPAVEPTPVTVNVANEVVPDAAVIAPSEVAQDSVPTAEPHAHDEALLGRVLPFIDQSRGVPVAAGEGLLVVEAAAGSAPQLRIGDRDLGRPPVAIALPAGRHELLLRRDGDTSFRYLIIRAGETRVLSLPAHAP